MVPKDFLDLQVLLVRQVTLEGEGRLAPEDPWVHQDLLERED